MGSLTLSGLSTFRYFPQLVSRARTFSWDRNEEIQDLLLQILLT